MENKKGFSLFEAVLIGVLIILALACAYYLGKSSNKEKMLEINNQVNQTTENTASITSTDWKEYKNDELGFSFSHPSDY